MFKINKLISYIITYKQIPIYKQVCILYLSKKWKINVLIYIVCIMKNYRKYKTGWYNLILLYGRFLYVLFNFNLRKIFFFFAERVALKFVSLRKIHYWKDFHCFSFLLSFLFFLFVHSNSNPMFFFLVLKNKIL